MKKYTVLVNEYDANLLAFSLNERPWFAKELIDLLQLNPQSISENRSGHVKWCVEPENILEVARRQFEIYHRDRKRIYRMKDVHYQVAEEMLGLHQKINRTDLGKASNAQIIAWFKKIVQLSHDLCVSGLSFVLIDYVDNYLTNQLDKILKDKAKEKKLSRKRSDYFTLLTQPEEDIFSAQEKEALYRLALSFQKGQLSEEEKEEALAKHTRDYSWLTYGFSGPPLPQKFFAEEIGDLLQKEGLPQEWKQLVERKKRLVDERRKALAELGLNEDEKYLFDLARVMLFLKGYRKETLVLGYYLIGRLAQETAKRTHLPLTAVRYLLPEEFVLLLEGQLEPSLPELKQRQQYMVFITGPKGTEILLGKKGKAYFGKHVQKEKVTEGVKELKGSVASPGLVKGVVKIVNSVADMEKMDEGDILVSSATQPDLLPAMKKAGAIVTDQGGMTCHAAIVSRELGKPCVIGTRQATKVLKDGDVVEVDASHGKVKKVK